MRIFSQVSQSPKPATSIIKAVLSYIYYLSNRALNNDRDKLLLYRCPVHNVYVRVGKIGQTLLDPSFRESNDPKVIDEINTKRWRERAKSARRGYF